MDERKLLDSKFQKLYQSVFPSIYRFLLRITRDPMVAEELCQEAFIKYLERKEPFIKEEESRFWLFRVGKNLALNHLKRVGREQKAYGRNLHEPVLPPETGEESYMKNESVQQVLAALNRLPKNLREVLVLKEYGELNYKEIAVILSISEANVKVRVYRARERLTKYFQDTEESHVSW